MGTREQRQFLKDYTKLLDAKQEATDIELAQLLNRHFDRLTAQSVAKRTGYRALDELNLSASETTARRTILETIIESSSDGKLKEIMLDLNKMRDILDKLGKIKTDDGSIASDVLQDDDAALTDRVNAFKQLRDSLGEMSDEFLALKNAYSEFDIFAR